MAKAPNHQPIRRPSAIDAAHEMAETCFELYRDCLDVRNYADWLDVHTYYAGKQARNLHAFLACLYSPDRGPPGPTRTTRGPSQ